MTEKDFLKMIKRDSLSNLYNFLDEFNLNSELYQFLSKIKIKLCDMVEYGNYDIKANIIRINEKLISKACKAYNDKTLTHDIYELIVSTFIHEYLHANRVVYIKDGQSIVAFEKVLNDRKNKHDISNYDDYLREIGEFIDINEFDNFVPVKISVYKNMKCDVIAYDKIKERYLEFINLDYSKVKSSDYKDFLKKLSAKLNNVKKYKVVKKRKLNNFFSTPDAYISDYKIPEITNIDEEEETLNYIENMTQRQEILEEAFTEGLARIIAKNPSKDELMDVIDEVSREDDVSEDALYALRMMEIGGEGLISWFLVSAHEEVYEDKFREFAGENYEEFLLLLDNICYGSTENNRKYLSDLMRLDSIFNEIEQRKR